jgi:hypothetical protein
MKMKRIATATLIASVALSPISPVPPAAYGLTASDVVAGLIIGGIIGSAITNENNKKKSKDHQGEIDLLLVDVLLNSARRTRRCRPR